MPLSPRHGLFACTVTACIGVLATTSAATAAPQISVDASQFFTISPLIYGMSWADDALARELRLPLNRWGGNHTSRYNWRIDVHNQGADWFFENIPAERLRPGSADPLGLPDTSSANRFIEANRANGTATLLTVPMSGWVAARRTPNGNHPYDCGFRQSLYGSQAVTDPWDTDCGNGLRGNGSALTGARPEDTSQAVGPSFAGDWLHYLAARYGTAAKGGVRYIGLDNEPELWSKTHRDVRPQALGYDELLERTKAHAGALKSADPSAMTLGPSAWGWTGYFYSDLDTRTDRFWQHPPDRTTHGGTPLVAWYLQQMQQEHQRTGRRLLDFLDLHFYPQADGVHNNARTDTATSALRLRQTRALWDSAYVDESWIGEPVRLLPRMREWVSQNYPGTQLAVSEYSFGAMNHISGALAQADVLGIFGREGVGLAALWAPPKPNEPGAFAFRMYRNFDGKGSTFGDVGLRTVSDRPDELSAFAARQGHQGAMTLLLINKTDHAITSPLHLRQFTPSGVARVWRYSAAASQRIESLGSQTVTPAHTMLTAAAQSITLWVIPGH